MNFVVSHSSIALSPRHVASLSSAFMKWDPQTWIIDLGPTQSYWLKFFPSLEKAIETTYQAQWPCQSLAILCSHPWHGLIVLNILKEQNRQGFFSLSNRFFQKLLYNCSWAQWWAPSQTLMTHFAQLQNNNGALPQFRRQRHKMEALCQRIGWTSPHHHSKISFASLQRRFGEKIALMWQWTFLPPPTAVPSSDLFSWSINASSLHGFPWVYFHPPEHPQVERHLDFPTLHWQHIKPLLQEDFAKLTQDHRYDPHGHFFIIQWQITLYHGDQLSIPISFKNPYSFQEDNPQFETAIQQTYYAFQQACQDIKHRDDHLDLPSQIPFISWKVTLCSFTTSPHIQKQLLQSINRNDEDNKILQLENRLSQPLTQYQLLPHVLPEKSFQTYSAAPPVLKTMTSKEQNFYWVQAAQYRPLYFFLRPRPIHSKKSLTKVQFLERLSDQWWHASAYSYQRDYYTARDSENRQIWCFQSQGEWFHHGFFS